MKTAFYVTDCSEGAAQRLRQWLASQADQSIRLTVIYPYDIEEGRPLTQQTLRPAKEEARTALANWSASLQWAGKLLPETVLASPELALSIYLLLRSYTFWLVDDTDQVARFADILSKTNTEPCRLPAVSVVDSHRYELAA